MKKFLFLIPLILFAACQSDDDLHAPKSNTITFGTTGTGMGLEWENGLSGTRAGDDLIADFPENFGVFAYFDKNTNQEVFNNQIVYYFYSDVFHPKATSVDKFTWGYWNRTTNSGVSKWPYTITNDNSSEQKKWEKRNYRFVAYSPWSEGKAGVSTFGYNFNTLIWGNIPEYSDRDHLIAKEIVFVDNKNGNRTTTELVKFEMQHLMARIRFLFKMGEQYRQIRRIVINSVSVQASGKQSAATITYNADNTLNSISWGDLTGGPQTTLDLIKESDEDYDVKTDFADASFGSLYILPQTEFRELTLTVNYTTYDSAGKATRNASITNTVKLAIPWNLMAGKYYDLKISIMPAYLYVLSDNDQDFDGWVIVNDHQQNNQP